MKKNNCLYFFEGIACILVVLIHVPFPGDVGLFFSEAGRLSVPLFFMISGYSLYDKLGTDGYKLKLISRLIKNAVLLGGIVLFYLVVDIAKDFLKARSTLERLSAMVGWNEFLKLILVNNFPGGLGGESYGSCLRYSTSICLIS